MRTKRRSGELLSSPSSSSSSMAKSPPLPAEAFTDILSRLPVKSLVRFESLSKPFSALIKSPDFISAHLRRSSRHPFLLIRRFHNPSSSYFSISIFDRQKPNFLHQIDIPFFGSLSCYPKIIGSCNGLVCLDVSPCHATAFVLWNISTKKFRGVLNHELTSSSGGPYWMVSTGFGYNRRTNDYKLVRIVNFDCKPDELPSVKAEVYSRARGSWKVIDDCGLGSCVINEQQKGVLVNGMLHWVAVAGGILGGDKFVVSFDLDTEEFKRIKLPHFAEPVNVKVMGFKGSLALAFYPVYSGYGRQADRIELWGLDVYGDEGLAWTRLHLFQMNSFMIGSPVGVLNENALIMKRVDGNWTHLSFIDPVVQGVTRLYTYEADYSCDVFSYVDSLVPVDAGHEVLEEDDPE